MMNRNSSIVVVGDSDLAMLFRLAGLGRYYVFEDQETLETDINSTLNDLINEPGISIIAIQSDYAKYARELIDEVAEDKNLFPVIIEVPSKTATDTEDAAAYYRAFVRKFVGFDIEI